MDIDQLKEELELLTMITPGDTIDVDTKTIISRDSWNRWWSGWYRGESRLKTIIFVEGICDRTNIYHKNIRLALIELAAKGIQNLELTYAKDIDAISRLRRAREKLDNLWFQRRKTTPLFIPLNNNGHYAGQSSSFPSCTGKFD